MTNMGNAEANCQALDAKLLHTFWPLPTLDGTCGKEERGHVLVVGGSAQIPGAVILAATAALRVGAGKLQIATARSVAAAVGVGMPEARVLGLAEMKSGELSARPSRELLNEARRCQALLLGPGMCDPRAAGSLMQQCSRQDLRATFVLDAGALLLFQGQTCLPSAMAGGIVLTPHPGEMAKIWDVTREEVVANAAEIACCAARKFGAVVALKGPSTYIASPDGQLFHNGVQNIGLGTSGSGDALSGIIAGLCARGADPLQAALWGVYLHSQAGLVLARKVGPLGFLARELLPEIPGLLNELDGTQSFDGAGASLASQACTEGEFHGCQEDIHTQVRQEGERESRKSDA